MRSIFQFFGQVSSDVSAELATLNQAGLMCVLCLFILLCVFLSGFCLLLYFRSNTCFKELQVKLDALEKKFQSQEYLRDLSDNHFKNQLDKDELKSRFENIAANKSEVPEKYRHVAQLERSGLEVKEIAEILDISQNEVGQIVSLLRISNGSRIN
jgi:hypothetical protein